MTVQLEASDGASASSVRQPIAFGNTAPYGRIGSPRPGASVAVGEQVTLYADAIEYATNDVLTCVVDLGQPVDPVTDP